MFALPTCRPLEGRISRPWSVHDLENSIAYQRKGGHDRTAADILLAIAKDDDDYSEFIQTTGPDFHKQQPQDNSFEFTLAEKVGTEDAGVERCNTFETLLAADTNHSSEHLQNQFDTSEEIDF